MVCVPFVWYVYPLYTQANQSRAAVLEALAQCGAVGTHQQLEQVAHARQTQYNGVTAHVQHALTGM